MKAGNRWLYLSCLALLSFALTISSRADTPARPGMAYYAMLHPGWPCDDSLRAFDGVPVPRVAVLWNTFGNETACLSRFLADPRPEVLEIHLVNETCVRDNSCGPYEALAGGSKSEVSEQAKGRGRSLIEAFQSQAREVSAFLAKQPQKNLTCFISPGLESNLETRAAEPIFRSIKPILPSCRLVWNPVGDERKRLPRGAGVLELHGPAAQLSPPCIANLDGVDIAFPERPAVLDRSIKASEVPDFLRRFATCEAAFLWIAEFNGLSGGTPRDPRQRSNFPTKATFELLRTFMER